MLAAGAPRTRRPAAGCGGRKGRSLPRLAPPAARAAPAIAAAAALLAGCAQPAAARTPIQLATAFVTVPDSSHATDAFLVIENDGPPDRLLSARTSVGGTVSLRGPVAQGAPVMRTVPDIRIPARQLVRLVPNGFHLLITRPGPMRAGTDITLTLVFARAGALSVLARVANPQNGGSSYFLN